MLAWLNLALIAALLALVLAESLRTRRALRSLDGELDEWTRYVVRNGDAIDRARADDLNEQAAYGRAAAAYHASAGSDALAWAQMQASADALRPSRWMGQQSDQQPLGVRGS